MNADLQTTLDTCEAEIRSGKDTFIKVGVALCRIRDERLYTLRGFGSFQEYCEEVWGWGKSYVSRVITAADIAQKLPIGNSVENESQARALAKVPEEKRAEVLEKAAQAGKVTAKTIEEAAADEPELPPPPPPRPVDDEWKAALGAPTAEPPVTEYYTRLERLVDDALENATDKQLVSMSVFASKVCHIIKTELREREQRRKKEKAA